MIPYLEGRSHPGQELTTGDGWPKTLQKASPTIYEDLEVSTIAAPAGGAMEAYVWLVLLAALAAPFVGLAVGLANRQRLRVLEQRIRSLELAADARDFARDVPPAAPATAPPPAATVVAPPPAASTFFTPPAPAPGPAASPPPAATDDLGWRGLEGRLGGTWLSRVGALVVTIGIGLFLKYAFDSGIIQPAGRVALGVAAGVALLVVGERLQRAAYRVPAQALVATGVSTLYLSIFAAFAFYHLLPQSAAFGLMVLVTATALALAIHHEARAIAVLANLGGFLTPVLLSTGRDAAVPLFAYLAILDAGMVASAYWRRWPELHALSFVFTHALYLAWFTRWYDAVDPPQRAVALAGASVFFVLFSLVAVVESRARQRVTPERLWQVTGLVVLAAPAVYFAAARAVLWPTQASWLALLCLALGAYYVAVARGTLGAPRVGPSLLLLHGAVALGFLTVAFPIQLSRYGTTIAWSVEGAALIWGGLRLRALGMRVAGLVVLGLAATRCLAILVGVRHGGAFAADNPALLSTLILAAAAGVAAVLYRPDAAPAADAERYARPCLTAAAVGMVGLLLTSELDGHARLLDPALHDVAISLVWLAAAVVLMAAIAGDVTATLPGLAALVLLAVAVKASTLDVEQWRWLVPAPPPVLNARFAVGLLITAAIALYARLAPMFPLDAAARHLVRTGAVAAGAVYLLWHLSAEVLLAPVGLASPGEMSMARHMALSILWTAYALAAMVAGIRQRSAALRIGALALFGVVLLKVFLIDLGRLDAGYRILSFLVLGAVLILASFMYTRFRERIAGSAP